MKFSLYNAGPVNNILVIRQQLSQMNSQSSSRRHGSSLPPPLEKYPIAEDPTDLKAVIGRQATCSNSTEALYPRSDGINGQIKELQVFYGFINILNTLFIGISRVWGCICVGTRTIFLTMFLNHSTTGIE